MATLGVMRTKCSVDWNTPVGSARSEWVNCAKNNATEWPWKYTWIKTLGTYSPVPPVTTSGQSTVAASFTVDGSCPQGQTVLRGIFAYIAKNAFSATVNLSANTTSAWNPTTTYPNLRKNITLQAILYNSSSQIVTTFFSETTATSKSATISLPATTCPYILWLFAAVQPSGEDPTKPNPLSLPSTTAKIVFTAT